MKESVQVINYFHSYHPDESDKTIQYFTDLQIEQKIEEIFNSKNPHYSRVETFNLVLEFIRLNTPDNVPLTILRRNVFNNIYDRLIKENRIQNICLYKNLRNENFELFNFKYFDSKNQEERSIICFCSDFQKTLIQKVKIAGIDCTFQTAPPKFAQVMVIIGKTDKINMPLSYFLLPSKSEKCYRIAFQNFTFLVNNFDNGVTFLCDFELGEINAIKSELCEHGSFIQLCFFHFVKAIKHFFAEELKYFTQTQKDEQKEEISIRSFIYKNIKKCCKMLPFIPHNKVYHAIEVLKRFSHSKKFADYFSQTYLGRYKIEDWSVFDKPQKSVITNNMVERHNRSLNDLFHHSHPTLEDFKSGLSKLENDFYNLYTNSEEKDENLRYLKFCDFIIS